MHMHWQQSVVGLSLLTSAYAAIGPRTNLFIRNKNISPDGFNRSTVLAGGTEASVSFPGPVISGVKGDAFSINVIDHLTDTSMVVATSVHWHGLFQEGSSWADGPVGVTQCPISPGNSFLYQFTIPDQAGTFWYHSHHATQYCDGLRGPLVIYDDHDPYRDLYDFDDDSTVISLADWYHTPAPEAGIVPTIDSVLINGLGRYSGGPASPLAVINVLPNKRYRFRLVSISCDPNFIFSIDGHTFTIIEVDGVNHEPLVVDSIQIYVGQRYSLILNTNQTVSNYWIRAMPNSGNQTFDGGLNSAILRYVGAPIADPSTNSTASNLLVETDLHPLVNPAAPGIPIPGAADVNINLDIVFNLGNLTFTVNGATFTPPTMPVLMQIMSGAMTAQSLLPPGSVYVLPPNKVIEISFPGGSIGSPHPIHLHGHTFSVIRSAGSTDYNFVNPVQRDVVSAGFAGDNTTIRFKTDNSGPWIMHCHIDWHLNLGLAVVMAENVETISEMNPPDSWDNLCPTYDALPPQVFT